MARGKPSTSTTRKVSLLNKIGIDTINMIRILQPQVNEWSLKNFGNQGYINPLLGIGEEIGEFFEASMECNGPEQVDAVGDIMIYLMNFAGAYKEGWNDLGNLLHSFDHDNPNFPFATHIPAAYGKMLQGVLKRRQGIRPDRWENAIVGAFMLVSYLDAAFNLPEIMQNVWEEVQARDWTKNAETGS